MPMAHSASAGGWAAVVYVPASPVQPVALPGDVDSAGHDVHGLVPPVALYVRGGQAGQGGSPTTVPYARL